MSRHSVRTWVFLLFALAFARPHLGSILPVVSPIPPSAAHVFQTDDYRIEIDTVAEDIGMLADADLTGYTCYRLFVTTGSPDDQLSAVFGNIDAPAALLTTGDFFRASRSVTSRPAASCPRFGPASRRTNTTASSPSAWTSPQTQPTVKVMCSRSNPLRNPGNRCSNRAMDFPAVDSNSMT